MPIPLIPIALGATALASAVTGLKKAWDAKQNFSTAKERIQASEQQWKEAAKALEASRVEVCSQMNELAMLRLQIVSKSIANFARLMDQIAAADFDQINVDQYELPIEIIPIQELENASYKATEFLQHGIHSAVTGVMVGAGLGQTVSMLGAASTGAAISGLSGAAATNATLAWLGGGSLASGGLGMAGGTVVLGSVVAGPFLLVMGYLAAGKSEEALTQAYKHSAELNKMVEQITSVPATLHALGLRSQELAFVLQKLDERFHESANRVSRVLGRVRREHEASHIEIQKHPSAQPETKKVEYSKLLEKDKKSLAKMIALGSALFNVAQIEIIDSQGRVTKKSEDIIIETNQLMDRT